MSNTITTKTAREGRGDRVSRKSKRISLSGARTKMNLDEDNLDPNYHYAWINDQKGYIYDAKRAGYEHVYTSELPEWGERGIDSANPVGETISMPVGQGVVAFLMKQPMEFYNEDRAELDALVDAREADMKKNLTGADGRYGNAVIERRK